MLQEGPGPEGHRGARVVWVCGGALLLVSGFNQYVTSTTVHLHTRKNDVVTLRHGLVHKMSSLINKPLFIIKQPSPAPKTTGIPPSPMTKQTVKEPAINMRQNFQLE